MPPPVKNGVAKNKTPRRTSVKPDPPKPSPPQSKQGTPPKEVPERNGSIRVTPKGKFKGLRDFITCKLCSDYMVDPKLLPCLHTFCYKCLGGHIKRKQGGKELRFTCPTCHHRMEVQSGDAHDFKDNQFVANLQDALNPPKSAAYCDLCILRKIKTAASQVCLECTDRLCTQCGELHQMTKLTADHNVKSLEEVRTGKFMDELRRNQRVHCAKHLAKDVEYYCNDCEEPICGTCSKNSHNGHDTVGIENYAQDFDNQIQMMTSTLSSRVEALEAAEGSHQEIDGHIKGSASNIAEEVKKWAQEQREEITRAEKAMLNELESLEGTAQNKNNKDLGTIGEFLLTVKGGVDYAERVIEYGKDVEKVQQYPDVLKRLQELQTKEIPVVNERLNFRFIPQDLPEKLGYIQVMTEETIVSPSLYPIMLKILPRAKLLATIDTTIKGEKNSTCPMGLAVNKKNQLLITDRDHSNVKIFNYSGELQHILGDRGSQTMTAPVDVAVDVDGYTLVSDMGRKKIFIYNEQKELHKVLTCKHKGKMTIGSKDKNNFIVIADNEGVLAFFDFNGKIIRTIDAKTLQMSKFSPQSVATNIQNNIVVSDWANMAVYIIDNTGRKLFTYQPDGDLGFKWPMGVCVDQWGHILVADWRNHTLHLVSPHGQHLALLATKNEGMESPTGLCIVKKGEVAVAEANGMVKIYKYLEV